MRFYQVHKTSDCGCSAGYEYFPNKKAADKNARQWLHDNPGEVSDVETIEVNPTKAGILRALNRYASHPDNG